MIEFAFILLNSISSEGRAANSTGRVLEVFTVGYPAVKMACITNQDVIIHDCKHLSSGQSSNRDGTITIFRDVEQQGHHDILTSPNSTF